MQDNSETSLELYERSLEAWGSPIAQSVACLLPILIGEAQLAAQQLQVTKMLEYPDING